jgi:hypothetical protein
VILFFPLKKVWKKFVKEKYISAKLSKFKDLENKDLFITLFMFFLKKISRKA